MGVRTDRRIRVGLVEDHHATRVVLEADLGEFAHRIEVVLVAADAPTFLREAPQRAIDVALVDLGLGSVSGIELIEALRRSAPSVRCVALTAFTDEKTVLRTLHAGAFGYLLKDEPLDRLVFAIEEAADGAMPLSSRVTGFLIARARLAVPTLMLSEPEQRLAMALAEGLTYVECAERLGIEELAISAHVAQLYQKLDVKSRSGVRAWVQQNPPR